MKSTRKGTHYMIWSQPVNRPAGVKAIQLTHDIATKDEALQLLPELCKECPNAAIWECQFFLTGC